MKKKNIIWVLINVAAGLFFICVVLFILNPYDLREKVSGIFDREETNDISIEIEEAKKLYEEGKTVFLDARSPDEYSKYHIEKAVNLSLVEFDKMIPEFEKSYNKDQVFVIYDADTCCYSSYSLYVQLSRKGFKNLRVFSSGWAQWLNAGYPSYFFKEKKEAGDKK